MRDVDRPSAVSLRRVGVLAALDGLVGALDTFAVAGLHLTLYLSLGLAALLVLVLLANALLL